MKKYILPPLCCLLTILSACCGKTECDNRSRNCVQPNKPDTTMCSPDTTMCSKVSSEDLAGIRKALDLYVQAAIEGNSKVARPAFAEGATISHAEDGALICLPIQALFDYYDTTGKHPASYEIAECSVAGDVAMVRIESIFGQAAFTDMFALVKDGAAWKIVSKIFQVK